jgi:hypothetical protein
MDENFNVSPTDTGIMYYSKDSTTTLGCDSIKILQLTVNPVYYDTIRTEICLGQDYTDENFNVKPTDTGIMYYYKDSITTKGCDSIKILQLTVNPVYYDTIIAEICLGQDYTDENFNVKPTDTGIMYYSKDSITTKGCDSIKILQLTVNPVYHDTIIIEICLGQDYTDENFNVKPTDTGIMYYSKDSTTTLGCDSIKILQLTVNPVYHDTVNATICLGERHFDANFDTIPTQAGFISYLRNYPTVKGCDSIFLLNLTVNSSYYDTIIAEICLGQDYTDENFNVTPTDTGIIYYSKDSATTKGCDSIKILQLTVNPSYDDTIYVEMCAGGCYQENGFNVCSDGPIQIIQGKKYYTSHGCDSIVTLNLTVHPVYDITMYAAICLGDRYIDTNFDTVPEQAGNLILTRNYTTVNGCDSIFTLNLTVNPSYHDTVIAEICLGENYMDENFDVTPTDAGIMFYSKGFITTLGCDSIKILQLTVHPVYDRTIDTAICLGESYTDENFNVTPTVAGIITDSVNIPTVAGGCDSIIRLHLAVNQSYYDTIIDTVCLGDTYNQHNFNEQPSQSGNFTFVHNETTTLGCDSITTLFLTVNQSYHDTIEATICLNEYYDNYGFYVVPFQRGIFTYVHDLKTTKNCDSITTLLLNVNPTYDEYVRGIIYEDEFYKVGNYNYNTPGLHISSLQTVESCDSIVNLYLDIIYYPPAITAFSPFNKDGINDYFMPGFRVQIFNRYGALVYQTNTVEEQELGWDGRNTGGQNVEPGLYFYILYNSSGKPRIKSSVEILKRSY